MKTPTLLLPILIFFLSGCDGYYFESPQPTDRTDMRRMPREFHGTWRNTGNLDSEADTTSLYIGARDKIWVVAEAKATFVDRLLTWHESHDSSFKYTDLMYAKEQKYDSTSGRMDTVVNFTVRVDKVFWRSDERISRGSIVGRSGDTVSVEFRDTTIYEIGELVRVRQIEKGLWTINFRDGLSKDAKGWWLVLLVEQRGDRIMVHTFSDQMDSRPSLVGELTGMYFFDTGLTASEIRNMMRDSLYTPYLELVRVEQSR